MTIRDGTPKGSPSLFSRIIDNPEPEERPAEPVVTIQSGPLLRPVVPPATPQSPPIEKLLDWLVNHWRRPTVNTRDIRIYGPNSVRDRHSAASLAEMLVERGWLAPIETRRRNMKHWRIARGAGE
jgi:hypothetical protein